MCRAATIKHLSNAQKFLLHPSFDIRGVFLDILNSFDEVWHDGLIFKFQKYGIDSKLLKLLKVYLQDRQECLILNGQTFSLKNIFASVPQGSVLGSLLFFI